MAVQWHSRWGLKYSIDTSALVHAWHESYGPQAFPGFWERLDNLIGSGGLRATEEVLHELEKQDDAVLAWMKGRPGMVVSLDEAIQQVVSTILGRYPRLVDNRKGRSGADPFVIALAKISGATVVCQEIAVNNPEKPKIPDVCTGIGVHCITVHQMILGEGWRFVSG